MVQVEEKLVVLPFDFSGLVVWLVGGVIVPDEIVRKPDGVKEMVEEFFGKPDGVKEIKGVEVGNLVVVCSDATGTLNE